MNMRRLLIIAGLIGVIIVIATLGDPSNISEAFERVHWYVFPLVLLIQIVDFYTNAKYYQVFFKMSGFNIAIDRLYGTSLAVAFANQAIPSGGIAGTTFLAQSLKKFGVPSARSTLAQLSRYIFTFVTFFIVLALGFLLLFLGGSINRISVRLIVLLLLLVLGIGTLGIVFISDRRRLEAVMSPFVKLVNSFGHKFMRRPEPILARPRIDHFLDELYSSTSDTLKRRHAWPGLLWWSGISNVTEILTLYAVFIGFGLWPNPGVIIAGYTVAMIASMTGIVIGGIAVYEAGMIGTFVALGVPFALSFAIVLVYRLTCMAIFIPSGLYFYRRYLEEAS
jgi:uncharacterized protein (TIRG00374 family)